MERALQVLERRAVQPQLGLLKSTMLQLDSAFSERAYGSGSFSDFVERLKKADYINVTGSGGRYISNAAADKARRKRRPSGRSAAGTARCAGNTSHGARRRRRNGRRAGAVDDGRTSRLQSAEVSASSGSPSC